MSDLEFWVSVLRLEDPTPVELAFLRANATHVRLRGVWLFEGMWEELERAVCLDEIAVPGLGGLTNEELAQLLDERWGGNECAVDDGQANPALLGALTAGFLCLLCVVAGAWPLAVSAGCAAGLGAGFLAGDAVGER